MLPNANSSEITSAIGTYELTGIAGEQVPLCAGVVRMLELSCLNVSNLKPNGLAEIRLNVGDVGPPSGICIPENHAESG